MSTNSDELAKYAPLLLMSASDIVEYIKNVTKEKECRNHEISSVGYDVNGRAYILCSNCSVPFVKMKNNLNSDEIDILISKAFRCLADIQEQLRDETKMGEPIDQLSD